VSVQAWFSNDGVEIDPGSSIALKLSVQNLGDTTQSYTIVPSGLTADWVNVEQGNITLFGGSTDVVDVTIAPPRLPTTTAGSTGVGVRIIPNDSPDDTVVAETTLDVLAFEERRIVALQPVMRARRRADFEFMVENNGNGLASCRIRLIDPSNRVDGNFDPPAVGVAPGGSSLVRLKAKAKRGFFRRSTRTLDFDVEAEQPGHAPADARMSFVQSPTIPTAAIGRVLAAAATLGLVALGWFHVVKPEIRDAANDRVDERLSAFDDRIEGIADELGEESPLDSIPEEEDVDPAADEGEPFDTRLQVTPDQLATDEETFSVPSGQRFDVTDLRVENANGDAGRAVVIVNDTELYSYSLDNIRGSFFEPGITPLRLQPGDNLVLSVRCDTVGDPAVGTCDIAINLRGRTVEVDEL